jgi:hypothetical protein
LDCGDAYLDLPEKVQAIFKWAYDNDYDYVAKCDDDVIVKPREWYNGFLRTNFSGWQDPGCKPGEIRTCWGFFYVLNRDCMGRVIEAPLPGRPGSHWGGQVHGNDEAFVATVLHYQNIFLTSDPRYFLDLGQKPKPGEGHEVWTEGEPKRSLRARPPRFTPSPRTPVLDWFCACVYL